MLYINVSVLFVYTLKSMGSNQCCLDPIDFQWVDKKAVEIFFKMSFVSDGLAMTSKWANDDRILLFFWWTIPLTTLAKKDVS